MRTWLKILREQQKLSQADVARKMGVTRQQYNYIEAGERQADLNLSTASALADIFNISLTDVKEYEEGNRATS